MHSDHYPSNVSKLKKGLFSHQKEFNNFVIWNLDFPRVILGKIKTNKFGLWPLSIKCDNTELLIYVTKLRMNKLRRDEFVPFDIIWKTSSGMDSHCSDCFISLSTESTHCNSSRSMGITWTRKMLPWFLHHTGGNQEVKNAVVYWICPAVQIKY